MEKSLRLSQIYRYPLKSGRYQALTQSEISTRGLLGDRQFLLVDVNGRFITARQDPELLSIELLTEPNQLGIRINQSVTRYFEIPKRTSDQRTATIWNRQIQADQISSEIDQFLSSQLQKTVSLLENNTSAKDVGDKSYPWGPIFSDGYPLLVTNQASLDQVNSTLMGDFEMLRFRPNLVLEGSTPWEEHRWPFLKIGEVVLKSEKPCERCVLITRDPETGEKDAGQQPLRGLSQLNRSPEGPILFGQNFSVIRTGAVNLGDTVELLESF